MCALGGDGGYLCAVHAVCTVTAQKYSAEFVLHIYCSMQWTAVSEIGIDECQSVRENSVTKSVRNQNRVNKNLICSDSLPDCKKRM